MDTIKITNYSLPHPKERKTFFPEILRLLIVGPSNCGKTNLLLNLIHKDWIKFTYLYIFSKTIEQKGYSDLREEYEKYEKEYGFSLAFFNSDMSLIPSFEECEPNSLVVFDDCILEDQSEIKKFFTMGRHKKISCVYLSQAYTMVDKKVIRNNLNFLCVFKQSNTYIRKLFDEVVFGDMEFDEFLAMCFKAWRVRFGFLAIDLTQTDVGKKFKAVAGC